MGPVSLGPQIGGLWRAKSGCQGKKKQPEKGESRLLFSAKSCFCVGQCDVGFMCIISRNLHDAIKRETLSFPFYRRQS